ncbi:hypothetical protein AAX26_01079 [Aliarcobacter thereius]|uniref:EF-hand domain-containing protein n=2 Tax=Aliarcobacter thereius TaxID=544718 RepID=A0A1C0B6L2_9BACT|nr:hypothetical protein [Aliarcobacter thereius]OCL86773.1 hypothetical protein AAX26_01079 [Aliarcobacter thereius]OCL90975.1 hypothetical protein AAX25_01143 [Aliarcobacter thereius]OCL96196.1 hypothetical protein AA347_01687 [Aliarcobacter thereius LMG 24486]OCL98942.1 hypothetical protein AAX29_01452 [Aliarcobacter thereius]QBF15839.1 hypothetical protein ATH_0767 [Aliarcobacter thereius LMG 24486]
MQITLSGNVFTSYDVKTKNSSKNENSFEETLQKQNQQSYQTNNQLSQTSSKTTFIDPLSNQKVSVSLENSTLEKLQNRFGEKSVVRNEAGDVELKDKAQEFVAGWFADIAYTRGFLKADVNNDGILSEEEYGNTRNDTNISLKIRFNNDTFVAEENTIENYSKRTDFEYISYRTEKKEGSIDDELNYTLNLDKDFDGNITLQEAYEGESSVNDKVKYDMQKLFIDSDFFKNDGYFGNYFNQALNYILEIMDKGETLDKDKWDQIRKDNYLKLDGNFLRLDMELVSTLDEELLKKLLQSFENSSNSLLNNSNLSNKNETTQEFLNRTNMINKEIKIYG